MSTFAIRNLAYFAVSKDSSPTGYAEWETGQPMEPLADGEMVLAERNGSYYFMLQVQKETEILVLPPHLLHAMSDGSVRGMMKHNRLLDKLKENEPLLWSFKQGAYLAERLWQVNHESKGNSKDAIPVPVISIAKTAFGDVLTMSILGAEPLPFAFANRFDAECNVFQQIAAQMDVYDLSRYYVAVEDEVTEWKERPILRNIDDGGYVGEKVKGPISFRQNEKAITVITSNPMEIKDAVAFFEAPNNEFILTKNGGLLHLPSFTHGESNQLQSDDVYSRKIAILNRQFGLQWSGDYDEEYTPDMMRQDRKRIALTILHQVNQGNIDLPHGAKIRSFEDGSTVFADGGLIGSVKSAQGNPNATDKTFVIEYCQGSDTYRVATYRQSPDLFFDANWSADKILNQHRTVIKTSEDFGVYADALIETIQYHYSVPYGTPIYALDTNASADGVIAVVNEQDDTIRVYAPDAKCDGSVLDLLNSPNRYTSVAEWLKQEGHIEPNAMILNDDAFTAEKAKRASNDAGNTLTDFNI